MNNFKRSQKINNKRMYANIIQKTKLLQSKIFEKIFTK